MITNEELTELSLKSKEELIRIICEYKKVVFNLLKNQTNHPSNHD